VLREMSRPQPNLLRFSLGLGGSSYGAGSLHVEAGLEGGAFLDREREWRAFLGLHGHAFLPAAYGQPYAFLVGARLGLEHKWRSSRLGPTVEAFAESGPAFEASTGARATTGFVGAGGSLGVSGWTGGAELQIKLTGGEVLRLDREHYSAFYAGFLAGVNW
jgi:hypothetical protein